jgi:cytochrome c-type biogenesis protein CcmF
MSQDQQRAVITVYRKPLVNWIWVGSFILIVGTLICLVPSQPGFGSKKTPSPDRAEHPAAETPQEKERARDEVPA